MRRSAALLMLVLLPLLGGIARAEDEAPHPKEPAPKPLTVEQAADRVIAGHEAGQAAALKARAAKDDPDPWLVADELCLRGKHDAAAAFAEATSSKAVAKLATYVAARRAAPTSKKLRAAFATLDAALRRRAWTAALDAAEGLSSPPRTVTAVRIAFGQGIALGSLRRLRESAVAFQRAAEQARQIGWLTRAYSGYRQAGRTMYGLDALQPALVATQAQVKIAEALEDRRLVAAALHRLGAVAHRMGRLDEARDAYDRSLALAQATGDMDGTEETLRNLALILRAQGELDKALELNALALAAFEREGNTARVADTLNEMGLAHSDRGEHEKALAVFARVVQIRKASGNRRGVAGVLINISLSHYWRAEYAQARAAAEASLESAEALGDKPLAMSALQCICIARAKSGEYEEAIPVYERTLALARSMGDERMVAKVLSNLSIAYQVLGDYGRCLEIDALALTMLQAMGNESGVAKVLRNMASAHMRLGHYPKALALLARSQASCESRGDKEGVAYGLNVYGILYQELLDLDRALASYEGAARIHEAMGAQEELAVAQSNMGIIHELRDEHDRALELYRGALTFYEARGHPADTAGVLGNIGAVYLAQGDPTKARAVLQRALALAEASGRSDLVAGTLINLSSAQGGTGSPTEARASIERALQLAREGQEPELEAEALTGLARVQLATGRAQEAVGTARLGVARAATLLGGLGDEQGARARGRWAAVFDVGLEAAAAAGDAAAGVFFLESGRAGALLEALGAREALLHVLIPPALRAEAAKARAGEQRAVAAYRAIGGAAPLRAQRKAREALDAARQAVHDVLERIQRTAKAGAAIAYPTPDTPAAMQARLRPEDALVLYGLTDDAALAVVIERSGARIVVLEGHGAIPAASERLVSSRAASIDPADVAALRRLVVEPLGLRKSITRLLVSPAGPLGYVAPALLWPEREVVYVPSGTTHGILAAARTMPGRGVLALGDPDYGRAAASRARARYRGAYPHKLTPLPATRAEVMAVGTVKLLAHEATEAHLRRRLATQKHWRAVHFACHGLVDADHPMLSSLAVTATEEDDGFLTCLEVFELRIPADLVVLSACETGKGKIYRTEGIVGLTRAFMFAGAPRVLCSLWKVDDEATKALMVKFYELWNPKEGKGLGAAAALKRAQEFVRGQEQWKHPYYWAAWVLWGLPE